MKATAEAPIIEYLNSSHKSQDPLIKSNSSSLNCWPRQDIFYWIHRVPHPWVTVFLWITKIKFSQYSYFYVTVPIYFYPIYRKQIYSSYYFWIIIANYHQHSEGYRYSWSLLSRDSHCHQLTLTHTPYNFMNPQETRHVKNEIYSKWSSIAMHHKFITWLYARILCLWYCRGLGIIDNNNSDWLVNYFNVIMIGLFQEFVINGLMLLTF